MLDCYIPVRSHSPVNTQIDLFRFLTLSHLTLLLHIEGALPKAFDYQLLALGASVDVLDVVCSALVICLVGKHRTYPS